MRKAPLGLLALLIAPLPGLAAPVPGPGVAPLPPGETMYMTGDALLRSCSEAENAGAGSKAYNFADVIECTAYISGALDQHTQSHAAGSNRPAICVPVGVTK